MDGRVTIDEFQEAILRTCAGKRYEEFPQAFKHFINSQFHLIDLNGDGLVGVDEYRLDCVQRAAFSNVQEIDDAYNNLLTDEDRKAGGINLARYQELYAQFISNPDEKANAVYLFGPLQVV
ncbi:Sarcoplasmic calcium-binding protein 1 [Armadillidium nasatum]|uniref:Sarcoplasmic calcium-binding protein 1 n=1 Tax=Armadillidium nasatum TaxID=96803 RepID=A0A5N5T1D9_9CRUS|nr:Sarcoplasmic calcium-binding protein 1 [Armadillidium nasatum]